VALADPRLVLAALPIAAASLTRQQRAREAEIERYFWVMFSIAPVAAWAYIWALDAEVDGTVPEAEQRAWLETHHPVLKDVLKLLEQGAARRQLVCLRRLKGELVKSAWSHLECAYALDRQPLTGGIHHNAITQEMAAQALLNWTRADAHTAWLQPETFADRWHEAGTADSEIRERAGLHAPELALLEAVA
jgi:hypothetical protein